jgi:hypothetical protein
MKTIKTGKGERGARRKMDRRRDHDGLELVPLGGTMDGELMERIIASIRAIDVEGSWEDLAPRILPVLARVRHPFPPDLAPLQVYVPPGIWTGFGIDLGPAFTHVTPATAAAWGVDRGTLFATALGNLRRLTTVEPPLVQRFHVAGLELLAVQGHGWGSALLLLPDVLGPLLGPDPRILLAPVRNTLVSLPVDAPAEVGVEVWHAVAEMADDELAVEPLRWTGATVVALDDPGSGRLD